MTWGFKSINDSNIVQIDELSLNYCATKMGTAASDSIINTADFGYYPHVFVKPRPGAHVYGSTRDMDFNPRINFSFSSQLDYEYALCTTSLGLSHGGDYGIRIRNGQAVTTYDSRQYQPYIATAIRVPGAASSWGVHDFVLPDSTMNWYFSFPRSPFYFHDISLGNGVPYILEASIFKIACRFIASNVVRFEAIDAGLFETFAGDKMIEFIFDYRMNFNNLILIAKIK